MKNSYILLLVALLAACSPQKGEEAPTDLAGMRKLLREKQTTMRSLTDEIAKLEADIEKLDPNAAPKLTLVTTQVVTRQNFKHYLEVQGAVTADDLIDITAEAGGRILKLNAKEGQPVSRGQLIAEIDLEQLDKQLDELETALELAKDVYDRQARLWEQKIGSEVQYLQAKNNKERFEKSIESLKFQMKKSKVFAPASGIVERVVLQLGELASPGMPIVQLLNPNDLKVKANVPESSLRAVKPGDQVTVQFPALNEQQSTRIKLIGRTIDPANRTFEVEAPVANKGGLIKPNLLAVMLINDYTKANAVMVPLEAVQQEVGGRSFVYIQEEGAKGLMAKKVYVTTGESYQGTIVIDSGLEGGEAIILEGSRSLSDEELIQVSNNSN